jgi:transcriptional regulator with XRE-family HTH domain
MHDEDPMHDVPTADTPRAPRRVFQVFAANVLEARERAGLTQEELAERSEVDLAEVERIELGATLPDIDTVGRLASVLAVPPGDLCAGIVWDPERQRFE